MYTKYRSLGKSSRSATQVNFSNLKKANVSFSTNFVTNLPMFSLFLIPFNTVVFFECFFASTDQTMDGTPKEDQRDIGCKLNGPTFRSPNHSRLRKKFNREVLLISKDKFGSRIKVFYLFVPLD